MRQPVPAAYQPAATKAKSILSQRAVQSALQPLRRKLGDKHRVIVHLEKELSNVPVGSGSAFLPLINEVFHKLDAAVRKNEELKGKVDHLYITVDAVLLNEKD